MAAMKRRAAPLRHGEFGMFEMKIVCTSAEFDVISLAARPLQSSRNFNHAMPRPWHRSEPVFDRQHLGACGGASGERRKALLSCAMCRQRQSK